MKSLELRVPPVLIFLLCAAAMWTTRNGLAGANITIPQAPFIAGALLLAGMVIAVLGVLRFRAHRTTVHPGKPDKATSLVQAGVYRYTRNPMYLGLMLCLVAWGLYLQNAVAILWILVFVLYMTQFQIKPEERILLAKFGAEYSDYARTVRRWF